MPPSAIINKAKLISTINIETKLVPPGPRPLQLEEAEFPSIKYHDHLAKVYEDAFSHESGLQKFIDKALLELPRNAKVLDIGCGTGKPVSYTMAAHGQSQCSWY